MRFHLAGFEQYLSVTDNKVSVLEIENKILFTRVCQSLLSGMGEQALEPYLIWGSNGEELKSSEAFKMILSPFDLPWMDKDLGGKIYARMDSFLLEDDALRSSIEETHQKLVSQAMSLGIQMQSDYTFTVEWEMRRFLKAFGYSVEADPEDKLLDNLVKLLELAVDVSFSKVFIFVNLKRFLSDSELDILYEQTVFLKRKVMLIENVLDSSQFKDELKMTIDQHFLQ